jgi:hypothetical protein
MRPSNCKMSEMSAQGGVQDLLERLFPGCHESVNGHTILDGDETSWMKVIGDVCSLCGRGLLKLLVPVVMDTSSWMGALITDPADENLP